MPPKCSAPQKKVEQKKTAKVTEDKTFGLKNKNKSKIVQQYVKSVESSGGHKGPQEKLIAEEHERKKQQKIEEERKALLVSLFKSVETVKNSAKDDKEGGENTVKICQFFKQGLCSKGKKCKLSHDIGKEQHKIDIYTDQRNQVDEEDLSEIDPDKLQEVIKQKEGQYKKQCATEIVCKFFLNALEKGSYGWKWMCPNGLDCHYRHCLPPGYVLKKDLKKDGDEELQRIEDLIDSQREGIVKANGTPITLERFLEWKKKRAEKKLIEEEKKKEDLSKKNKGQKKLAGLTGRALFVFDPSLFQDDADAVDDEAMKNREDVAPEEEQEDQAAIEQRKLLEEYETKEEEEEEEEEKEEEKAEDVEEVKEDPKVDEKEKETIKEIKVEEKKAPVKDSKYIEVDESELNFM